MFTSRVFVLVVALLEASSVLGYPHLSSNFRDHAERGLNVVKKDQETWNFIQDLYRQQIQEKEDFFARQKTVKQSSPSQNLPVRSLEQRSKSTTCLTHPLPDFTPSTIATLKKFPEHAYPYKSPMASDQRGPCPGLNAMANHGYISRSGIVTFKETVAGSAKLFNMGVDLASFLAAGSVAMAGDLATMKFSIGGADGRTNSLGVVGGKLGTETGLSGHLRDKEGDASGTRCDFYLCNGDNHNLKPSIFLDFQQAARANGNQYNIYAVIRHFANQYQNSRNKNPFFYFFPPQAALSTGAIYFIPGMFSNGTIGHGGVANEASIASFLGVRFNSGGSVSYQPEQIPPQGWYRRGYPLMLPEAMDAIQTMFTGASILLNQPFLFGANTGKAGDFTGSFGLSNISNGDTQAGFACFLEEAVYGSFVSEFSAILNYVTSFLNAAFKQFQCPTPTGAPPQEAPAPNYPGYPKPSPCTLNKMQNGFDQCAPDTNTYGTDNSMSLPYCLNKPTDGSLNNPLPVPGMT